MRLSYAVVGLMCIGSQLAGQTAPSSRAAMTRYRREFVSSCVPKVAASGESSVPAKSLCGCMIDKVLVEYLKAHSGVTNLSPIVLGTPRANELKTACLVDFSAKHLGG